jgi:hypothetical protein
MHRKLMHPVIAKIVYVHISRVLVQISLGRTATGLRLERV